MKQKLKISIGSSLQKAATCLTVAATIAALGFTFSCSSDNDYEEPWLNKEHRTRAGIMTSTAEENVVILGKRVKPGCVTINVGEAPGFEVAVSWSDGYVGGGFRPQSTISVESICLETNTYGSISSSSYDLRWNGGNSSIEGTITVNGFYIPEHFNSNIPFCITRSVSARVRPTIYTD